MRNALADHDRRRVRVARGQPRHHRCIGHAQPDDAANAELRVDDGPDRAGSGWVVEGERGAAHEQVDRLIGIGVRDQAFRPSKRQVRQVLAESWLAADLKRQTESVSCCGPVAFLGQEVVLDARL
jgi:hypothetical protein